MRADLWLWLIVAQFLWAGGYVAMKIAGAAMPVGTVVVLRYALASLCLGAVTLHGGGLPRFERRDLALIIGLGTLVFAIAPTLQVTALRHTRAVDVSVLIAFEPILTVLFGALALRERVSRATLAALGIGTVGMLILSGVDFQENADPEGSRLLGNLMFLASLLCEAAFTVAGHRLATRYRPIQTIFAMKVAGFLTASILHSRAISHTDFGAISWQGFTAVLYLALFSSVISYVLWYHAIAQAPVNHVALSLFAQPVFGSAIAYFMLNETLGTRTLLGATVVCASLAWWQIRALQSDISPRQAETITVPPAGGI